MKKWAWLLILPLATWSAIRFFSLRDFVVDAQISTSSIVSWYSATPPISCPYAVPVYIIANGYTGAGNLYGNTSTTTGTSCSQLGGGGSSGVSSFNTRTGAVTLTAADVNAVGAITNSTTGTAALASGLNSTALAVANPWTANQTAPVWVSNIATGTAPFTVTSTTPVANLSIGGNAATATALAGAQSVTFTPGSGLGTTGTPTCACDTADGYICNSQSGTIKVTTTTTPSGLGICSVSWATALANTPSVTAINVFSNVGGGNPAGFSTVVETYSLSGSNLTAFGIGYNGSPLLINSTYLFSYRAAP